MQKEVWGKKPGKLPNVYNCVFNIYMPKLEYIERIDKKMLPHLKIKN